MTWDDPIGDLRRFIAACEERYRNPPPAPEMPDSEELTIVERAWLGEYLRGMDPAPIIPGGVDVATWEMDRRFKLATASGPRRLNRAERRARRPRGNGGGTR